MAGRKPGDNDRMGALPGLLGRALPPTLLAMLCAAWTTYPAFLDGKHVLIGDWRHPDMLSNHWLYCWVARQLATGDSIVHNMDYYQPIGDAPYLAGNAGDAPVYALLQALLPASFSWPGSLTLWVFMVVFFNVIAAYGLCRTFGAGRNSSLFGAATLGIFAYAAHELCGARFSQLPIFGILTFLVLWTRFLERPSPLRALPAGVVLGCTAMLYWYYGLWAAWMGVLLGLAWLLSGIRGKASPIRLVAALRWGFFMGGVALLTAAPLLWLFMSHWADIPGSGDASFPNPLAFTSSLPLTFTLYASSFTERGEVLLSLAALALALLGLWKSDDWKVRGLLAIALVFYGLALGPEILLPGGSSTGIPGPFNLAYGGAEVLRRYWWPYRHVLGLAISVAVLAALGLDRLLQKLPPGASLLLPWLLVALLPVDLELRGGRSTPAMTWWEAPEVYEELGELEPGAVLELPLAPELVTGQQSLIYQLIHGKALVNGHAMWVDRVRPPAWDRWVQENSFLNRIQEYERGEPMDGRFAFEPGDMRDLLEQDIRYLVVNAEYFPKALYGLVDRYPVIFGGLFGEPVLRWQDQFYVWDMQRYSGAPGVDAPLFTLPVNYRETDGNRMLDLGHNRSLGFRGLTRLFPPQLPPGGAPGTAGEAHPDGQPVGEALPVEPVEQGSSWGAPDRGPTHQPGPWMGAPQENPAGPSFQAPLPLMEPPAQSEDARQIQPIPPLQVPPAPPAQEDLRDPTLSSRPPARGEESEEAFPPLGLPSRDSPVETEGVQTRDDSKASPGEQVQ